MKTEINCNAIPDGSSSAFVVTHFGIVLICTFKGIKRECTMFPIYLKPPLPQKRSELCNRNFCEVQIKRINTHNGPQ